MEHSTERQWAQLSARESILNWAIKLAIKLCEPVRQVAFCIHAVSLPPDISRWRWALVVTIYVAQKDMKGLCLTIQWHAWSGVFFPVDRLPKFDASTGNRRKQLTPIKACLRATFRRHRQNITVTIDSLSEHLTVFTTLSPSPLRSPSSLKLSVGFQAVRSAITVRYSDGLQTLY